MDFTGKKVVHNRWGEGIIKRITTIGNYDYYDVQFADGQHTLLFPDAFREATVFANSNDQYELRQMIVAHEWQVERGGCLDCQDAGEACHSSKTHHFGYTQNSEPGRATQYCF